MKIQIYSDLHNEFSRFEPSPNDADVVILAGDIDLKSRGVKWANETFQCPVIYVCGNHQYYGGHIEHESRTQASAENLTQLALKYFVGESHELGRYQVVSQYSAEEVRG